MLAATGGSSVGGGQVFAIHQNGKVDVIGSYAGPGGAENITVAPPRFGSASGAVLIAVDEDHTSGRVLAMDRRGRVQTIASGFGTGVNPIDVIEGSPAKRSPAAPGGQFWLIRPAGKGKFETLTVTTDLPQQAWNLEGSTYVR